MPDEYRNHVARLEYGYGKPLIQRIQQNIPPYPPLLFFVHCWSFQVVFHQSYSPVQFKTYRRSLFCLVGSHHIVLFSDQSWYLSMSSKIVDTYESCLKNKSPNPKLRFCRNLFFNSVWYLFIVISRETGSY